MIVYAGQSSGKHMLASRVPRDAFILGILLLLWWTSVLPAAAAIVREPYLQQVTPTSVTVVWRTDDSGPPPAQDSQVQFGTGSVQVWGSWSFTETATAVVPPSNPDVRDHIVTITNLTPGTTYFYAVGTVTSGQQSGGTTDHFFVTAPTVGSATPFRAWIVGDSGNGSADQIAVRDAMLAQPTAPDIFLHMGDIAYGNGTDQQFTDNHFVIYQDILRHMPTWPTIGNHETPSSPSPGVGPYYEAHVLPNNEAYYSFDYSNVHFIVLDSMTGDRGGPPPAGPSPMLDWLQTDLASTTQDWIIAYWHHPPYSKGSHDSDNATALDDHELVEMRENVLPILEAGGVNLVIAGHSHSYERSLPLRGAFGYGSSPNWPTPDQGVLIGNGNILDTGDGDPNGDGAYQDGTVYIVAGHGGRSIGSLNNHPVMFHSEAAFGSVLLDIDDQTLTARNLNTQGTITDLFSMILPVSGPPTIVTQPSSVTVVEGQNAQFNVVATGTLPLTYQWQRDDGAGFGDITGETASSYTLSSAQLADSGAKFRVIVDNAVGPAVTSAEATLTVNAGGGTPVTAWEASGQNPSGSWRNSGFNNRTFRVLLKGSAITTSGSTVQVTLRGRTSGSYTVENLSLVERGNGLNGVDATFTPVTFSGGASSVTVPANQTVTSDAMAFNLAPGQDVFLTYWLPSGTGGVFRNGGTEDTTWFITGTDQSGVIDWGGLSISGTRSHIYNAELVAVVTTSGAPAITTQPSSVTVVEGQNAQFNVVATGTPPLTYQWQRDDGAGFGDITGETASSYTLSSAQLADSGAKFRVIVDNAVGPAVTSAEATLTVNAGGGTPVTAWEASGQNPSGSWNNSGFNNRTFRVLLKGSAITTSGSTVQVTLRGRTSGSYTVENLSLVERGNGLNGVDATFTPVTFSGGASSVTVPANQTVTSDAMAFNLAPGQDVFLTYWLPSGTGGVFRNGGTEDTTWFITGTDQSGVIDWGGLSISGTRSHIYNAELVAVVTTSGAPAITTQPSSVTVVEGQNAQFNVVATGTLPLTYQWQRDDGAGFGDITGETASSYTLSSAQLADSGAKFRVIVDNAVGPAVTSAEATLTVNAGGGTPVTAWEASGQNPSGSWNNSGFNNRTFRVLLKGSAITTSGSTVQVTLRGRTSGSYTVENLSLVERGNGLNGVDATFTPVTFSGGASSVTVPANQTVTSDAMAFNLAPGQDVFLTYWLPSGTGGVFRNGGTEDTTWFITGTDQSGVIDWGGLSISGTRSHIYNAELVAVVTTP